MRKKIDKKVNNDKPKRKPGRPRNKTTRHTISCRKNFRQEIFQEILIEQYVMKNDNSHISCKFLESIPICSQARSKKIEVFSLIRIWNSRLDFPGFTAFILHSNSYGNFLKSISFRYKNISFLKPSKVQNKRHCSFSIKWNYHLEEIQSNKYIFFKYFPITF